MQISDHYLPYAPNTYIVVASADRARVLVASDRSVEETKMFEAKKHEHDREHGHFEDGSQDSADEQSRRALYQELGKYLVSMNPDSIVLCIPEAHSQQVQEQLPKAVVEKVSHLIPKNLASLPIDAIIRILQERQA